MNVGSVSYSGLVSGDNFVVSATGTFDNKNIGTGKTVTISSSYLEVMFPIILSQINHLQQM